MHFGVRDFQLAAQEIFVARPKFLEDFARCKVTFHKKSRESIRGGGMGVTVRIRRKWFPQEAA